MPPKGWGEGIYMTEDTRRQIRELMERFGLTKAAVVRLAIEQLHKQIKEEGK